MLRILLKLRWPLIGLVATGLILVTSTALAGSGPGGVFNLGQANKVDAASSLGGTTGGPQLTVLNNSTAAGSGLYGLHAVASGNGAGVYGRTNSAAGPGVLGYNSGGGPGLQADVSSNSVPPLEVNSSAQVPKLDASLLGGNPAATFYRLRTDSAGNRLTTLESTGNVGYATSATIGTDGLGLISYGDATNGLKVAHCSNVACSSATTSTNLDSTGGGSTSITIGSDGLGLISYSSNTNTGELKVAHCANVACSSATTATVDDGGVSHDAVGQYNSITIGGDGLGLISYYDSTAQTLKVAHCTNIACSMSTKTTVDSTNPGFEVGMYSSITTGADGLGLISYQDTYQDEVKVAHCTDYTCSSPTKSFPDQTGIDGSYTSITIGSDGYGLIAYHYGGLRIVHCADVACSSGTATSVSGTQNDGFDNSITIGADGLGLISHYDHTNNELVVSHCADVACSSATTATLDYSANVGQYNAITTGADGLPLIGYFDGTNQDLKVAHCASSFCTPYFRRR